MMKSIPVLLFIFQLSITPAMANDTKTLTGDWEVAVAIIEGNEVPAEFNKMIQLQMRGKQYMTSRMGEVVDEGTFELEMDKMPPRIQITGVKGENAGKKILGIYKLEGKDKLTFCYSFDGKAYPEKFEAKSPGMVLITYTRRAAK